MHITQLKQTPSPWQQAVAVATHVPSGSNNLHREELATLYAVLQAQGQHTTLFYDGVVTNGAQFASMMLEDACSFYTIGIQPEQAAAALCRQGEKKVEADWHQLPLVRGRVPLGFWWLNGFMGSACCIHFCIFRYALPIAPALGRFVVRAMLFARPEKAVPQDVCWGTPQAVQGYTQMLEAQHGPGGYCLNALYGLTPAPFRHALHFVYDLGFQKKTVLPYTASIVRPPAVGGQVEQKPTVRPTSLVLSCLTREGLAREGLAGEG